MKNVLPLIICLNVLTSVFCQNNPYTNVDTNYLRPKWMSLPLSVNKYRSGNEIYKCESEFEFAKTNKPAYFVKNLNGIDYFFYNQRVLILSDGDTLAPKGYKVAGIEDYFSNLNYLNVRKVKNNQIVPMELIDLQEKSLQIKFNGYIDEGYYDNPDEQYFWTPTFVKGSELGTAIKFETDHSNSVKIELDKPSFVKYTTQAMYRGYGLNIYCLENLNEIINDSIFDYKKILPDVYEKLLYNISKTTRNGFTEGDFIYQIKGSIDCSGTGEIKSRIVSDNVIHGEIKKTELLSDINSIMKDLDEVPYYNGKIVKAHSDILITFKIEKKDLLKQNFESYKLINNKSRDIYYANENRFKWTINEETIKIEDESNIYSKKSTYAKSFTSRGPIYSIASALPGMGLYAITRKGYKNAPKKALLVSSISLGVISFGSKLYSNLYYNRYRKDLFGEAAAFNYKKANTLQKVFLTTGIGYCILGAIDFTWTFSIGYRNKVTQHRLNNQIKANPSNFILK